MKTTTTTDRLDAAVVQREVGEEWYGFQDRLHKLRKDSDGSPEAYIGIDGYGRCIVQVAMADEFACQRNYSPSTAAAEVNYFLRHPETIEMWGTLPAHLDFFSEFKSCDRVIRLRSTEDTHTDRLTWLTKAERAEMAIVDKLMELESRERNPVRK